MSEKPGREAAEQKVACRWAFEGGGGEGGLVSQTKLDCGEIETGAFVKFRGRFHTGPKEQ